MKLQALGYSLLGNVVLAIVAAVCAWQWAESGAECEGEKSGATLDANVQVRQAEAKRDEKLDAVAVEVKADTRDAVRTAKEDTHERAEAIDRVPAGPGCAAPVGLPALDAAVDQANAAAGD